MGARGSGRACGAFLQYAGPSALFQSRCSGAECWEQPRWKAEHLSTHHVLKQFTQRQAPRGKLSRAGVGHALGELFFGRQAFLEPFDRPLGFSGCSLWIDLDAAVTCCSAHQSDLARSKESVDSRGAARLSRRRPRSAPKVRITGYRSGYCPDEICVRACAILQIQSMLGTDAMLPITTLQETAGSRTNGQPKRPGQPASATDHREPERGFSRTRHQVRTGDRSHHQPRRCEDRRGGQEGHSGDCLRSSTRWREACAMAAG